MENQPINIIFTSQVYLKRSLFPKSLEKFNIHTIGTAESYEKIKKKRKKKEPDLLVLEFEFIPNEIKSLIQKIKHDHPAIKILIISAFTSREIAESLIENGASGYYDQHCPDGLESLAVTISSVNKGETIIIPSPHARITPT